MNLEDMTRQQLIAEVNELRSLHKEIYDQLNEVIETLEALKSKD